MDEENTQNNEPVDIRKHEIEDQNCVERHHLKKVCNGLLLLLPVLCFGSLGYASINLVADQLVYVKFGGEENRKETNDSSVCFNRTNHEDHIQEQTTQFRMYMRLGSCITCFLFIPVWGAHSDRYGRHIPVIISSIGAMAVTLSYIGVLFIEAIPLWVLIIGDIIHGLCGRSFNILILAICAFIADVMPRGQRTFMMITMDFIVLLSATASQVSIGYWIKSSGFAPSLIFMIACQSLVAVYALFILPRFVNNSGELISQNLNNGLKEFFNYFVGTYKTLTRRRENNTRANLLIIVAVVLLQHTAYYGASTVQNIYFLGPPLCWNSVMLGIFNGVSIGAYGTVNMLVALLFIRRGSPLKFICAGLISAVVGNIVFGFSQTTWMMFVGLTIGSLLMLVPPSARVVISDLVDESEQGAALAGYVLPTLTGEIVGNSLFTMIDDETIDNCSRCFYFVAAGLYGAALLCPSIILFISRKKKVEDLSNLIEDN